MFFPDSISRGWLYWQMSHLNLWNDGEFVIKGIKMNAVLPVEIALAALGNHLIGENFGS